MVEWSITVVLKTTVPRGTGGSNPSLSAKQKRNRLVNKRLRFPFIGLHPFLHPLYALVRENKIRNLLLGDCGRGEINNFLFSDCEWAVAHA